jgi:hypothetical protein
MARDNTRLLVIARSIPSQFENLCRKVLQHSREVDRRTSTNTLSIVALLQQTVDTADRELDCNRYRKRARSRAIEQLGNDTHDQLSQSETVPCYYRSQHQSCQISQTCHLFPEDKHRTSRLMPSTMRGRQTHFARHVDRCTRVEGEAR